MKKVTNVKGGSSKGSPAKAVDNGELKKPTKLKPLKEKEKKGWKNKLGEEEDDLILEDDLKFDDGFAEEDDEIFDDEY
jgi:hypothetical protein